MSARKRMTPQRTAWLSCIAMATADLDLRGREHTDLTPGELRDLYQRAADSFSDRVRTQRVQFTRNAGGKRIPAPMNEQFEKAARFIAREAREVESVTVRIEANGDALFVLGADQRDEQPYGKGDGKGDGRSPEGRDGDGDGQGGEGQGEGEGEGEGEGKGEGEGEGEGQGDGESPDTDESPKPEGAPETSEYAKFIAGYERALELLADRERSGMTLDDLSGNRPAKQAAAMIAAGITADACLDAMTAHWPADAREELGVTAVRPETVIAPPKGARHEALGYMLALAEASESLAEDGGLAICLHGPAGVGKTTAARDFAQHLGMEFGMISLAAGLSTTALTGSLTLPTPENPSGYVSRQTVERFESGGVMLFDEFDAGDANLLLIVNSMIANRVFHSPVTGRRITAHRDFIPIAAVNTLNGADSRYTGRSRLDAATMDRFRMGRVRFTGDPERVKAIGWDTFHTSAEYLAENTSRVRAAATLHGGEWERVAR